MAEIADLVFTPLEEFAAVDEPGAEAIATAEDGSSVIPADGTVLVFGDGGAGKTTITIDLGFSLATGESWLGLVKPSRPLRILLIEAEGPRQEFRDKLERKLTHHGDRLEGRIVVLDEPWAEFTFADEKQRRALALAISEHEADLIIVGPVASVGMIGGGTPDEIRAFEQLLRDLRTLVDRPLAILLVHHENRAGQVSGAWERVPCTLMHVTGLGHGRTRIYWQKVRHSSALHQTTSQLLWADGESYTVEAKPEITEETMTTDLLQAVRENPGASWSTIRDADTVTGKTTDLAKVRDRLIAAGALVNSATRDGYFNLWHPDDPACPRSQVGTALERLPLLPPAGASETSRSPVPYVSRNGYGNGTAPDVPEAPPLDDDYGDRVYAELIEDGVV